MGFKFSRPEKGYAKMCTVGKWSYLIMDDKVCYWTGRNGYTIEREKRLKHRTFIGAKQLIGWILDHGGSLRARYADGELIDYRDWTVIRKDALGDAIAVVVRETISRTFETEHECEEFGKTYLEAMYGKRSEQISMF